DLDLAGNGNITGASGNITTGNTFGYGVLCTYSGFVHADGGDAPCRVTGTTGTITGSLSAGVTGAIGIACAGSCATKDAACKGSCEELRDNKSNGNGSGGVTAGTAQVLQTNVHIQQSSPTV